MKQENKDTLIVCGLILFLGVMSILATIYIKPEEIKKQEVKTAITSNKDSLTLDNVSYYLNKYDILCDSVVFCQVKIETNNLKSYNCIKRNNLFGFRLSNLITNDNPNGYITFDHWKHSISYYKTWQDKWYNGEDYLLFLSRIGYAEDSLYCKKIKNMLK